MEELKESIGRVIVEALGDHGVDYGQVKGELAYAEDIVELPQIKEALMIVSAMTPSDRKRKLAWAQQAEPPERKG